MTLPLLARSRILQNVEGLSSIWSRHKSLLEIWAKQALYWILALSMSADQQLSQNKISVNTIVDRQRKERREEHQHLGFFHLTQMPHTPNWSPFFFSFFVDVVTVGQIMTGRRPLQSQRYLTQCSHLLKNAINFSIFQICMAYISDDTVVPPNSRLIGSKKDRELGDFITVVNRSSQKLLLSKIKDICISRLLLSSVSYM